MSILVPSQDFFTNIYIARMIVFNRIDMPVSEIDYLQTFCNNVFTKPLRHHSYTQTCVCYLGKLVFNPSELVFHIFTFFPSQ